LAPEWPTLLRVNADRWSAPGCGYLVFMCHGDRFRFLDQVEKQASLKNCTQRNQWNVLRPQEPYVYSKWINGADGGRELAKEEATIRPVFIHEIAANDSGCSNIK